MSRWGADAETVCRRIIIGTYDDRFDGPEHALAALSRADTTEEPQDA